LTINKAAQVAQPGDSIIVHAGEYRELVQPARGGTSDAVRIVYTAGAGEKVFVKGSERITNWVLQSGSMYKADVPNTLFGSRNPFSITISDPDGVFLPLKGTFFRILITNSNSGVGRVRDLKHIEPWI
jgi:hypothetical protein